MIKLLLVVGTRPNYIKITQFKKVAEAEFSHTFDIKIVHTGQHFDKAMADDFFKQLDIYPDYALNIPQTSANKQIGEIMIRLEDVINEFKPHMLIVPGDVNSTLAAALTANKMGIPLAHIEAGLRSFDRSMPEEINRVLVDEISNIYFVTEQSGLDHLKSEGKPQQNIHFVGNTMIDTLVAFKEVISKQKVLETYNLKSNDYVLMTIHRPATADHKDGLEQLINLLRALTKEHKVVFPMHPRTMNNIKKFGLDGDLEQLQSLVITGPLDYFSFQHLIQHCKMVLTDSGGIQEETTFLKKPCLTLRPNTERPSTIITGTNTLLDFDVAKIMALVGEVDAEIYKKGYIPELWDGKATQRILSILKNQLEYA